MVKCHAQLPADRNSTVKHGAGPLFAILSRYILYGLQHLLSGGMEDPKLHLSLDAREMGTTLGAWQLAHKKMVLETHWRLRQPGSGIESAFWVCQSK